MHPATRLARIAECRTVGSGDVTSAGKKTATLSVHLRLRQLDQLFDLFDPSEPANRRLSQSAEAYMVDCARGLGSKQVSLVVHIDPSLHQVVTDADIRAAVRHHFASRGWMARSDLRTLLRRGWISLVIGMAFLISLVVFSEVVLMRLPTGPASSIMQEGLLIVGWVAMWRPIEVFLFDWWPMAATQRTLRALAGASVSFRVCQHQPEVVQGRPAGEVAAHSPGLARR